MPAVKIYPFNSTQDLIQAVREERVKTGLKPPTCLWRVCHDRRLNLSASEKHIILSEIASHASLARQAKVHRQRLEEEKGTMFPQIFTEVSVTQTTKVNKENTSDTLLTQPKEPCIVQDLLPGIILGNSYQYRPHHWPRRR